MSTIKKIRQEKGITQSEASKITNIPLRTFKLYENDASKEGSIKYNYIIQELGRYGYVDEEHGVLSVQEIKNSCREVFEKYNVKYAYLFGSYAKGTAGENSDVDLVISTKETGLKFYGIVEELRTSLKKKVDVLDLKQLENNIELVDEILKFGVKIYG